MNELTIVLNTVEARVQMVLFQGERDVLCAQEWNAPSRGTEIMPAALGQMCDLLRIMPSDIARIACANGPGGFTGIRLALSFAAAVRRGSGARLGAIDVMQALALTATASGVGEGRVRVMTHARHGLVHGRDFRVLPGSLPIPLGGPEMWTLGQASDVGRERPVTVVGSGLARNAESLTFPEDVVLRPEIDRPSLDALVALASAAEYGDEDLEPVYLRPCDAVDNLPHIAELRGDRPEAALAELDHLLAATPPSFDFTL